MEDNNSNIFENIESNQEQKRYRIEKIEKLNTNIDAARNNAIIHTGNAAAYSLLVACIVLNSISPIREIGIFISAILGTYSIVELINGVNSKVELEKLKKEIKKIEDYSIANNGRKK